MRAFFADSSALVRSFGFNALAMGDYLRLRYWSAGHGRDYWGSRRVEHPQRSDAHILADICSQPALRVFA